MANSLLGTVANVAVAVQRALKEGKTERGTSRTRLELTLDRKTSHSPMLVLVRGSFRWPPEGFRLSIVHENDASLCRHPGKTARAKDAR